MNRLSFFKSLGVLAGSFLIPSDKILAITDFVENRASSTDDYRKKFLDKWRKADFVSSPEFKHRIRFSGEKIADDQIESFRNFVPTSRGEMWIIMGDKFYKPFYRK